ncbi:hypothetical protein J23TS9_13370 [Paenibacillus sp. J23TS9]|nr:hypothetical protein J23TS9_13370 [Paenibacillus sp. J23TS9]
MSLLYIKFVRYYLVKGIRKRNPEANLISKINDVREVSYFSGDSGRQVRHITLYSRWGLTPLIVRCIIMGDNSDDTQADLR